MQIINFFISISRPFCILCLVDVIKRLYITRLQICWLLVKFQVFYSLSLSLSNSLVEFSLDGEVVDFLNVASDRSLLQRLNNLVLKVSYYLGKSNSTVTKFQLKRPIWTIKDCEKVCCCQWTVKWFEDFFTWVCALVYKLYVLAFIKIHPIWACRFTDSYE